MTSSAKESPTCDITRDLTRAISNINLLLSPTYTTTTHTNSTIDINLLPPHITQANKSHRSTSSIFNDDPLARSDRRTSLPFFDGKHMTNNGQWPSQQSVARPERPVRKKKEIYKYTTNWPVSYLAWSNKPGEHFTLALCSFIETYKNHIQIVSLLKDDNDQEIQHISTFDHPYPATKVLWMPQPENYDNSPHQQTTNTSSLIATTADYLRIWRVQDQLTTNGTITPSKTTTNGFVGHVNGQKQATDKTDLKPECLLNYHQGSKYCAPLTSFDWNDIDPRLIVTSSVDTTCAIWDIEYEKVVVNYAGHRSPSIEVNVNPHVTGTLTTQLVAHDHQVYDVSFSRLGSGRDIIISCSGDRSVRMFDLRKLSTSSVLFESLHASGTALVRVSCSKRNPNLVSTFAIDSSEIIILDVRKPATPLCTLKNHHDHVNGMSWAPHSSAHICTGADDQQALIWDLSNLQSSKREPLLAYQASGKINSISWSSSHNDWIAISYDNNLELLRV